MKALPLLCMIFLISSCCQGSQSSSSSTSIASLVSVPSSSASDSTSIATLLEKAQELENSPKLATESLRKCIKQLREAKNAPTTSLKEKDSLSLPISSLRITWAKVLLQLLIKPDQQQPKTDEIIECIKQLGPAIDELFKEAQQAWANKTNRDLKVSTVNQGIVLRNQLIGDIQQEERLWKQRSAITQREIADSPDKLPDDLLTRKGNKHPQYSRVQEQLGAMGKLLEACKKKAYARKPIARFQEDDDEDFDSAEDSEAEDAQAVAKMRITQNRYAAIQKELTNKVLSTCDIQKRQLIIEELNDQQLTDAERAELIKTIEQTQGQLRPSDEIQDEFMALITDLDDQTSTVFNAISDYRLTLQRITVNREAYKRYREIESSGFESTHNDQLKKEHETNLVLKARLKFWLSMLPRDWRANTSLEEIEELEVQKNEMELLEKHEEELSPTEIEKLYPGFLNRWKRSRLITKKKS